MSASLLPVRIYYRVFAVLLLLTGLTVAVSLCDLGEANVIAAITIAVVKAAIVVLFFMHVKYSARLVWVFAAAAFMWLALLISLSLGDILTRGWLPAPPSW